MITVIGNKLPRRVRGVLELWLLEPKPGVFVGSLNSRVEKKLFNFIVHFVPPGSGYMIVRSDNSVQGFSLHVEGDLANKLIYREGLALIAKN